MNKMLKRKSRLQSLSTSSSLMDISVVYGDEKITFNLREELIINENIINRELKEQPSSYAFIAMLHKKLVRRSVDADKKADRAFAKAFIKFKTSVDTSTSRVTSKEVAKEQAELDPIYIKLQKSASQAKEEADIVYVAVRSFEQRQSLIQTISANLRRENI